MMEHVSVLEYWRVVRKRLWLVLLLALVGSLASGYFSMQAPPQYRSTTTLFLNPAAANPLLPFQSTKTVESVANTYIEFMRTRSFAGLVAEQSGLALAPEDILKALSTQYVADTQFFRIIATTTDAQMSQALANTAAEVLIAQNSARQQAEQAQIQSQRGSNPEQQRLIDLRDSLQSQISTYNDRISQLQAQLQDLQLRQASARTDQRISQLQQELLNLQSARLQTLTSITQAQSSLAASTTSSVTPVDTAVVVDAAPPAALLPRNIPQYVLLGLAAGLIIGFGLAFALEYMDYTIRTPEALDLAYGQQSLGVIGKADDKDFPAHGPGEPTFQLTAAGPRAPVAESIRSLRTSIQLASLPGSLNTLMVTSAGPGEGKSFVACNLAVSMAQQGSQVVLVDLDLRKPYIHTAFGLEREPGFTNLVVSQQMSAADVRPRLRKVLRGARNGAALRQRYLVGADGAKVVVTSAALQGLLREVETDDPEALAAASDLRRTLDQRVELREFLQQTHIENLWVLTSGVIPPNPAELLSSPQAAKVMKHLQEFADIVIYDTPPAVTVTDAVIVAQRVDVVLQVVAAGKTRIDLVRRCKALLLQAGVAVVGPVLNQVRLNDLGYYSYYYQGYYQEGSDRKRSILSRLRPRRHRSRRGPPREQRQSAVSPPVDDLVATNGHLGKIEID
jgi:Mrp family chromosome partitioning ATPase/capsular polysaccharide biosynthesis protein